MQLPFSGVEFTKLSSVFPLEFKGSNKARKISKSTRYVADLCTSASMRISLRPAVICRERRIKIKKYSVLPDKIRFSEWRWVMFKCVKMVGIRRIPVKIFISHKTELNLIAPPQKKVKISMLPISQNARTVLEMIFLAL
jgi:hypothetical protein